MARFWPRQKQPINFQRQMHGPAPAEGMLPPSRGETTRNGLMTPFAQEDPIQGPGRASERYLQAQSATPLNAFLSELVPDTGGIPHFHHAHRIQNTPTHYYPTPPWWPDQYAKFQMPGAYTSIRPAQVGFAPPGLQRTAGGLQISVNNLGRENLNTQLAKLYEGARAPTSFNRSGGCK